MMRIHKDNYILLFAGLMAFTLATCCNKELIIPVESISINKEFIELDVGEETSLSVTINPNNATNKDIIWKSSNPTVVTVNDGLIKAIRDGNAEISATINNKHAICSVKVISPYTLVQSIVLDKTSAKLKAGETLTLNASVYPGNATDKTVSWASSNERVASVVNGVVTAKKLGTTTITASAGGKSASCVITVEPTPVTSIVLDKTSAELKVGQTLTLNASVLPEDATDKTVSWASSDESVASVVNGVVTAKKLGTTTITASAGEESASCVITVEATPVISIVLDKNSAKLRVGQTLTLNASVLPEDATDKTVSWASSDESVASVINGIVTAKKLGTTTITASVGGKSTSCVITVEATPVTSIVLDKTSAELKVGQTLTLNASVFPEDATDKTVSWTSSDDRVASVINGVVTAKKLGTTTITASAGGKSASCVITIEATPVTSIVLDKTSAELKVGQTLTLNASVYPENATDKTVSWTSSDDRVASVVNGVVTAKKIGTSTITASAGGKSTSCVITVETTPVTSIVLDKTSAELKVGQTLTLNASVFPEDATDKTVSWTSSDDRVASVVNGVVTAKMGGKVIIKAYAGQVEAECKIKIIDDSIENWQEGENISGSI